jgi:hypothetical protein
VKHVLHTGRLYVLPEALLATELSRFEFGVVLFDQIELHDRLVGFQVGEVGSGFSQVVQVLGVGHRAIVGYILHGLGLGLGGPGGLLDAQLVQEVVGHQGLAEGHWLIIVFCVYESLLNSILNILF